MNAPGVIGRPVAVIVDHDLVFGLVIDATPDYSQPKRVRLKTGEHAGEVRGPNEYQLARYMDDPLDDIKAALCAWAEEALA